MTDLEADLVDVWLAGPPFLAGAVFLVAPDLAREIFKERFGLPFGVFRVRAVRGLSGLLFFAAGVAFGFGLLVACLVLFVTLRFPFVFAFRLLDRCLPRSVDPLSLAALVRELLLSLCFLLVLRVRLFFLSSFFVFFLSLSLDFLLSCFFDPFLVLDLLSKDLLLVFAP